MTLPRFSRFQLAIHFTALLLAAWLVLDLAVGNLGVNPIQAAEQRTGRYAIYFLVSSLACTPLNTVFGFKQAVSGRRALGVYAFLFALLHFSIFVGIDYGFQLGLMLQDVGTKKYILAGAFTLTLLFPLAITSFQWWMKRLGKSWKRLHRLVYIASLGAILHFAWARKGDLFNLRGDILAPLATGLIVLILMVLRVPAIRRKAATLRHGVRNRAIASTQSWNTENNLDKS